MKKIFLYSVYAISAAALVASPAAVRAAGGAEAAPPSDATSTAPHVTTREDLEALIRERTARLDAINRDLATTQNNLKSTQAEKASLQKQLKTLQYNISQLELNIKADDITSQKLSLEIDSLNYDIHDIELSIADKRSTIVTLLRELQQADEGNLLITFLKSKSLADGVLESQSLKDLRNQISTDIASLADLRATLGEKVSEVGTKKQGIELHRHNLASRKLIVQDQKQERQVILTRTQSKESAYAKQLTDLKKQQDALADEISDIEERLRSEFDVSLLPRAQHGAFLWPLTLVADGGKGRITQDFGERSALYRGKAHNGLDIGAPIGTPVFAAENGVVSGVDNNDRSSWQKYQYGRYVLIRHPNGLSTLYAHLSRQIVSVGQSVKRGDLIGYSGSTGYATGPHLHFGVYWSSSITMRSLPPAAGLVPVGVVVAPEPYL